ncbi:dihydrolipoamide acetyltransferase component of pyruvate dehydrogenase complex [Formosa agariphila KMM 3901]|uniref:Acetyltransferase component of pyruvate dehydrogenase complex n=1 Tax=Formosa agariphila (strain DSM 15362 / KCTC 12365 / LMG 23005 / KMM 3901 / M-2Alg 35-1) TaxID=1347342 RepID=T2KNP1_FORAG|nr:pyruvate dehydrogenase complex dihydrolipoamide acetyltransferase [Formosa agariphila]CDF80487.1 dihydrolipoamide acetyltransferase component of pyruvate dehydrogenase complex [Formosa agariphila KMM 3901]
MAEIINMPRLSDTMEEGTVAAWLKKVGDKVTEGDILAEIETDKATMEFESFHEGTLLHIGVQEGETTKVDELLAIIGDEGEDISALVSGGAAPAAPAEEAKAEATEEAAPVESAASAELPEGVVVVTMPRLSDTMEEGTVATWLKKEGDTIEEGDILAEIETDKATMEFESFNAGTLLHIGLQEGESAKVDSLLAIIGPAGTDVSGVASNFGVAPAAAPAKAEAPKQAAPKAEAPKAAPAPKDAAPAATPKVSNDGGRLFVSPLAKKIADEKGYNIADIPGSGESGRIIKRDVENFTPKAAAPAAAAGASFASASEESFEEIKNSNMRKAIAKNLAKSKFSAPHYYLNVEFDMDNAIAFRKEVNAVPDTKISFNDIVVKACAMALKEHPQVNSQWFDDKMRLNNHVHIGVAVAVEDGLLVPVVKFADQRKLTQIGAAVKEYAIKAKTKKLSLEEMEGSTFTISNLGMFGIDSFTSIINQPNSAILSVGAIVQKPVVKDGAIVVGNTMKLCLAADHRTIDGATGAQFLQTLKGYIENPISMLL